MHRKAITCGFVSLCFALVTACGSGGSGKKPVTADDKSASSDSGDEGGGDTTDSASGAPAKLKLKAPKVGTKALEKRFISLDFELTLTRDKAAGGMQAGSWSIEEERGYEVQASEGEAVTKLGLVFGRREAKALLGVEQTAATAGHSYVLESSGGTPTITPTKAKDLKPDERDAINAEYDWIGQPNPLLVWLDGGKLKAGKKREGGAAEARALLGVVPSSEPDQSKVTVTSRGPVDGERPALGLDVEAHVRIVSGETTFDLSLKGPAKIDLETGWVQSLDLSGTAKAGGRLKHKKGMLDVSGTAKAALRRSLAF